MKLFTFFYYSGFETMLKDFPDKDPYKLTRSDISFPLGLCFACLFMLILFKIDVWDYVIANWDPEYVKGGKFNPFAPSSVLFFICWFLTSRGVKAYFGRPKVHQQIMGYYRVNGQATDKYNNYGRLLLLFIFICPVIPGVLGAMGWGWYSAIPLLLCWLVIELLIRYEFEWRVKPQENQ
ncbi:hypothetical protein HR060_01085 [Catenovulum sp. SM1970]|uniref:hypothetical protein n=1 Tax=Marinifaba aquimaris TaxID=2741323 RepID=UPI001573E219|nr:hypothetical protein [Marinifaba aquimaris]NTS75445.1 hypothetical protein [Marinifaba aquimaris]